MARLEDRDGTVRIVDNEDAVVLQVTDAGGLTLDASLTVPDVTISDDLVIGDDTTITDGGNIILGTTTGTKIGTATSQKLGFFNVTPVVRPTAFVQTYSTAITTHAAVTATAPATTAAVTTASGRYGYASLTQANAITTGLTANIADVLNVKKVLTKVIDDLQALGLLQ